MVPTGAAITRTRVHIDRHIDSKALHFKSRKAKSRLYGHVAERDKLRADPGIYSACRACRSLPSRYGLIFISVPDTMLIT